MFQIPIKSLSTEQKSLIKKECNIWEKETQFNKNPEVITIFSTFGGGDEGEKVASIPIGLWKNFSEKFPNANKHFDRFSINIPVGLSPKEEDQRDQKTVLRETFALLKEHNVAFLALRTGFGKTFCGLYALCKIGLKTLWLCHQSSLHQQVFDEAKKFFPDLIVQVLKPSGKKLNPNAHVYIMGIRKSLNFDFTGVGLVIVDEVHLTLTDTFSRALLNISPKYLIGLSATPDRRDGMHELLFPFFGEQDRFIVRKEIKNFTVIKYKTFFRPEIKYNYGGILDWTTVVRSISCNTQRQKFIAGILKEYPNERALVLCDRVCEIVGCVNYRNCKCPDKTSKGLVTILKEEGETVDYSADDKNDKDETCRIMIGTKGKLGTGYDSDRTLLVLSLDLIDVRQYEGRIRKHDNIVIDIVDNFGSFEKHWNEREKWFIERGATILYKKLEEAPRKRLLGKNIQ